MRSKKCIETIKIEENECIEKEFENYADMAQTASEWTLFCPYQFRKNSFIGMMKILELPSIQIVYVETRGGSMFELITPKECVTVSVMKNISNKACVDEMKLKTDMIAIIDDKKIYNFFYSDEITTIDVSFKKNTNQILLEKLTQAVDHYYIDKDKSFADMLKNFIDIYGDNNKLDTKTSRQIEKKIVDKMLKITDEEEKLIPHFTKSEKIAIKIKRQFLLHMDGNISISSLAKRYNISEKSLQNAFKSLYNFTPLKFMRLLKLNHVYHDLVKQNSKDITVSRVAQKWGFKHMGKFSKYYTELFGENPSTTLKNSSYEQDVMSENCVQRQEEI